MLTDKVLNQVEYVQLLKEKAIFIKFSEIDSRHRHVVSIDNLTGYLSNLKKSYNNYVEESFKKNFLQLFSNLADLNKAVDRIQENLQLRIVDAKIASFGIGLSADTMSLGDDMRREVKEWSSGIIEDYNNEVIGLDYSQADNLNEIMKTYSPEARKKIFKPILDIYADKSVEVSVSVKNLNSAKKVNKPNKQSIKNLVEISQEITPVPKEKEFVTIAVEVEKGADLNKIPKKVFSSQPLFERRSDTIELTKTALQYENVTITFKSPLVLNVVVKDGVHVITSDQLGIATENEDLNNGLKVLTSIIYNCWLTFLDAKVSVKQFQNLKEVDSVTKLVAGLIETVEEQK